MDLMCMFAGGFIRFLNDQPCQFFLEPVLAFKSKLFRIWNELGVIERTFQGPHSRGYAVLIIFSVRITTLRMSACQ